MTEGEPLPGSWEDRYGEDPTRMMAGELRLIAQLLMVIIGLQVAGFAFAVWALSR
jgi:hypothetical protein